MTRTIEYCVNNVSSETRSRLEQSDHEAIREPCLQRCGDCFASPYLVIDGTVVEGSHDDVLSRLETVARDP